MLHVEGGRLADVTHVSSDGCSGGCGGNDGTPPHHAICCLGGRRICLSASAPACNLHLLHLHLSISFASGHDCRLSAQPLCRKRLLLLTADAARKPPTPSKAVRAGGYDDTSPYSGMLTR